MRLAGMLLALPLLLAGCRQDMHDQPKYEPLEKSRFFTDQQASRPAVAGTVARGQLREDAQFYTGKDGNRMVEEFPLAVDLELVRRGQERFNIYCTPCHSALGDGNGMIVQRGFRRPQTFHQPRLRNAPPGYFYDVITNGFGAMPDYRAQIAPRDRWAIIAYIRALQLSQNAGNAEVPATEMQRMQAEPETAGRPEYTEQQQPPQEPAPSPVPRPRGQAGEQPR
jgi:mono/diheme cytochrome c family protein